PSSELSEEVNTNSQDQRDPAQTRGHAVDHRDWRNHSHANLKGTKADIGHAIFGKHSGLELGVDNLQQRNTGRDRSSWPAPAKDATLNQVYTEELGWEQQQEEYTEDGAEHEHNRKRHPVASNCSWCDRSNTESNEVVRRSTGNR